MQNRILYQLSLHQSTFLLMVNLFSHYEFLHMYFLDKKFI
ncbi:Uncharacterised protein [Eikenella corrodens]|uniref:Uncharacterized protein n=1 Tax=Eikenella corrodens TaxID=539 RepID=A0A8B4G4U7_EIKCO|nr:Uncharacterised protein [Eikenella corrodens]